MIMDFESSNCGTPEISQIITNKFEFKRKEKKKKDYTFLCPTKRKSPDAREVANFT